MVNCPYWHVIRFLDHPLLPANTPPDFPKIVKHGIDDDGPMHPESPHVSAPDGAATLMYKMGREKWLERFLDVEGTEKFKLVMTANSIGLLDLYMERSGNNVEIGFLDTSPASTPEPGPGVRYRVQQSGEWSPISTSDQGSAWGGTSSWIRCQGESFCKAVWYDEWWSTGSVTLIDWSGITDAEKEENRIWCEEKNKALEIESEARSHANVSDEDNVMNTEVSLREYYNAKRKICRGGCGEKNSTLVCSRCKNTCYCSVACQREDWKYHKSVCGKGISDDN